MSDWDLTFASTLGLFGVALYMGGYAALQFGFVRGHTYTYSGINLAAASCVLFSLTEEFNFSSALIQISWIVISLVGIARLYHHSRTRFSEENAQMLMRLLPGLDKERASKVLRIGDWRDVAPGTRLTTEGQPVDQLGYLSSGSVIVSRAGVQIAILRPGALIGEITYKTGDAATADILAATRCRVFCLQANTLRTEIRRDPVLGEALELSIAGSLREKLVNASTALIDAKDQKSCGDRLSQSV